MLREQGPRTPDALIGDHAGQILRKSEGEFGLLAIEFDDPGDGLDIPQGGVQRFAFDAALERFGVQSLEPCREPGVGVRRRAHEETAGEQ